jgi:hypothetical protein
MRHGSKLRRGSGGRRPLLAIIPILVLVAFTTGGCTKMTGGGWIPSLMPTQKATFGFSAKCKDTTIAGVPAALLYEGQFQFTDKAMDVSVHGDVEPTVFATVVGSTCRQVGTETNPFGAVGQFEGRFRTQDSTVVNRGDFLVQVADSGKSSTLDGDELCVDLFGDGVGGLVYKNCNFVQGGNIKVE